MNQLSDLPRSPPKAIGLAVVHFTILVIGMIVGSAKYDDWDFAPRYVPTLAVVAVLLATITVLMGPSRRQMGVRAPELHNAKWLLPGVLIVVAGAVAFAMTWSSLPQGASIDGAIMARTALATAMVGFAEEWTFRGLVVAALVHRLGFRNGGLLAAAAFGVFHIGNVAAGAPIPSTIQQVVFTALLGLTFLLMALATRSLIPSMIAHACYDFFILAAGQLEEAGADKSVVAGPATMVVGLISVIIAVRYLTTTTDTDPYPVTS